MIQWFGRYHLVSACIFILEREMDYQRVFMPFKEHAMLILQAFYLFYVLSKCGFMHAAWSVSWDLMFSTTTKQPKAKGD